MFTGIVEGLGTVHRTESVGASARLVIDLGPIVAGVELGDSVAVNGGCLTATRIEGSVVDFDVSRETLSRTTHGDLASGEKVNLERALRVGDRLGGHFVLGHVDGVGMISAISTDSGQTTLEITASADIVSRLIPKGSVAVSGMSLTIADLKSDRFSIAIIPHTLANTTLPAKRVGDKVNLELDVIGKYVERLMARAQGKEGDSSGVTANFLAEHGFI
jgi:riboflavin synthase